MKFRIIPIVSVVCGLACMPLATHAASDASATIKPGLFTPNDDGSPIDLTEFNGRVTPGRGNAIHNEDGIDMPALHAFIRRAVRNAQANEENYGIVNSDDLARIRAFMHEERKCDVNALCDNQRGQVFTPFVGAFLHQDSELGLFFPGAVLDILLGHPNTDLTACTRTSEEEALRPFSTCLAAIQSEMAIPVAWLEEVTRREQEQLARKGVSVQRAVTTEDEEEAMFNDAFNAAQIAHAADSVAAITAQVADAAYAAAVTAAVNAARATAASPTKQVRPSPAGKRPAGGSDLSSVVHDWLAEEEAGNTTAAHHPANPDLVGVITQAAAVLRLEEQHEHTGAMSAAQSAAQAVLPASPVTERLDASSTSTPEGDIPPAPTDVPPALGGHTSGSSSLNSADFQRAAAVLAKLDLATGHVPPLAAAVDAARATGSWTQHDDEWLGKVTAAVAAHRADDAPSPAPASAQPGTLHPIVAASGAMIGEIFLGDADQRPAAVSTAAHPAAHAQTGSRPPASPDSDSGNEHGTGFKRWGLWPEEKTTVAAQAAPTPATDQGWGSCCPRRKQAPKPAKK